MPYLAFPILIIFGILSGMIEKLYKDRDRLDFYPTSRSGYPGYGQITNKLTDGVIMMRSVLSILIFLQFFTCHQIPIAFVFPKTSSEYFKTFI